MNNQVFIKDISEILLRTLGLSLIFFLIIFYFDNKKGGKKGGKKWV